MKRRTFNVILKRVDNPLVQNGFCVRACSGELSDWPDWDSCPPIEGCNVAKFLKQFFDKDGDIQEFKVTFTKKEKK